MAGSLESATVDEFLNSPRFSAWNQQNMEFQTVISKQLLSHSATANTHSAAKGGGFDMVSMEMEETANGGDLYGPQVSRAMQSVMAPSHSVTMQGFMYHAMPKSGRKFPCKMCSQVLDSKAEFQMHNQSHMREPKPYRCSLCIKTFANSSYLSQHMRIHLGIKPYHCDVCKKKFTQLSHLQQHIRTHTGDKPYRCPHPTCTKAFSQLSNLQSHSRCHQQDKPFKCNSCYKCFYDEQSLLEHIPKHKDSKHLKTHICHYCGKSYTQETYLQRHMSKHADKAEKQHRLTLNHVKTSADIYWPKQELSSSLDVSHRFSQEDLQLMNYNNQYSAYGPGYSNVNVAHHHAINPYNTQTAALNYDTAGKSTGSAFAVLSGSSSRSGLTYYSDPFNTAMKSQNGLSDIFTKNGQISAADHFANFSSSSQAMRNVAAGFNNAMPTMLNTDNSLQRKDNAKNARY